MIQLPDAIVIYPQKKSVPGFLLCWIPGSAYEQVVAPGPAGEELPRLYPDGIEVELTEAALAEAGIALGVEPARLREAYLALRAVAPLPESGMVELAALETYLEVAGSDRPGGQLSGLAKGGPPPADSPEGRLLRQIAGGPPMTGGQDAGAVYGRLTVAPHSPEQNEEGG